MWKKPTEQDLACTLSQGEIDAFRQDSAVDGADPVEALLTRTVATVRSYIRANAAVLMDAGESTIPLSCMKAALDLAAFDVLKRLPVPVGEDRRQAKEDAQAFLEKIASGALRCEDGAEAEGTEAAATPRFTDPRPPRRLD